MTNESINWLVLPFAAVSKGTFATEATASLRLTAWIACKMSNGNSASLTQYSMTSSGRVAHSWSMLDASTSILCLSSSSGKSKVATKERVSRRGLSACRACHHVSITARPATFQARFVCRLGTKASRLRFISDSRTGVRPHPSNCDWAFQSFFFVNAAVLSARRGRSKLSIL